MIFQKGRKLISNFSVDEVRYGIPITSKISPNDYAFAVEQLSRKDQDMLVYFQKYSTKGSYTFLYNKTTGISFHNIINLLVAPQLSLLFTHPGFCTAGIADVNKIITSPAPNQLPRKYLWLVTWWGQVFAHMVMDSLPRIAQLSLQPSNGNDVNYCPYNISEYYAVLDISEKQPIVWKIWEYLGIDTKRLHEYAHADGILWKKLPADEFLFLCDGPIHPTIEQTIQRLLRLPEIWRKYPNPKKIVYCTRSPKRGGPGARECLNEDALFNAVEKFISDAKLPYVLEWFDLKRFHGEFLPVLEYFADVRAIIGPHGSALENIHFCQPGTLVIEMDPVRSDGRPATGSFSWAFWAISEMLGHEYWMWLAIDDPNCGPPSVDYIGNFNVNVPDIIAILNKSLIL
jgi:hypothetical protein